MEKKSLSTHLLMLGKVVFLLSWLGQATGIVGTSLALSQADVPSVA